ncbi:hypothetical protein [Nostoc sp.]|uniref:hypothetical protein n=1 Tax=Nostoc sp. TaxID=1180 RepID=UPI002FF4644E
MKLTVQELIEQLQGFPADSAIAFEFDSGEEEEFNFVGLNPGEGKVIIVLSYIPLPEDEEE